LSRLATSVVLALGSRVQERLLRLLVRIHHEPLREVRREVLAAEHVEKRAVGVPLGGEAHRDYVVG
jgi:hypothetical protein